MSNKKNYQEIICEMSDNRYIYERLNEKFEQLKEELDEIVGRDYEIKEFENTISQIIQNRCAYWEIEEKFAQLRKELSIALNEHTRWAYAEYYKIPEEDLTPELRHNKMILKDMVRKLDLH